MNPDRPTRMPWLQLWFSFRGRATRFDFWVRFVFVSAGIGVLTKLLDFSVALFAGSRDFVFFAPFISILMIWPTIAVCAKRCHDRNHSGWFLLWYIAPLALIWNGFEILLLVGLIGAWAIIGPTTELGFRNLCVGIVICFILELGAFQGTRGPNRYGSDPRLQGSTVEEPRVPDTQKRVARWQLAIIGIGLITFPIIDFADYILFQTGTLAPSYATYPTPLIFDMVRDLSRAFKGIEFSTIIGVLLTVGTTVSTPYEVNDFLGGIGALLTIVTAGLVPFGVFAFVARELLRSASDYRRSVIGGVVGIVAMTAIWNGWFWLFARSPGSNIGFAWVPPLVLIPFALTVVAALAGIGIGQLISQSTKSKF